MNQSSEDSSDMEIDETETAKTGKEPVKESPEVAKESKKETKHDEDSVDGSESDSDLSDSEYFCSECNKKFSGYLPFKQHEKSRKHTKTLLKKKREKKLLDKITDAEKGAEEDEDLLSFIKEPFAVCKTCSKNFGDADSYHAHLVSKSHKQKKIQSSILDQVREGGKINVDMLKDLYKSKKTDNDTEDLEEGISSLDFDDENEFECTDCEKSFSGIIPFVQHLKSKTHDRKIEDKKLFSKLIPDTSENAQYSGKSKDLSTLVVEDDILVCKLCSTSFSGPQNAMMHLKSRNHAKKLDEQIRRQRRREKVAETTDAVAAAKDSSEEDSDNGSEDKSDSEENDGREDEKLSALKETTAQTNEKDSVTENKGAQTNKKDSVTENKGEKSENENTKDKDNTLLAYERYKSYKEIMEQVKEQDK